MCVPASPRTASSSRAANASAAFDEISPPNRSRAFAATRCRDAVRTLLAGYRSRFRDMGVDYAVLTTDQSFDRALSAFLTARSRRSRRAEGGAGTLRRRGRDPLKTALNPESQSRMLPR